MKKHILFAAAALVLVACSNDDENINSPVEARISAGVDDPTTRAINDRWEADAIGVRVTASSSDMEKLYKNVKYTTAAQGGGAAIFTSAGQGIFFRDDAETVSFAAYGPYQESAANALPGTSGIITGSTAAQSTRKEQKAFDYIFASGATASRSNANVRFTGSNAFAHKMTRLVVIVEASDSDGFRGDEAKTGTYTLGGLNHNGQFDVTNGKAEATGTEKSADWSLSANSLKEEINNTVAFTSILYPQTLSAALAFKAEIGGRTYTNSTIRPDLEAGKSYTYTVTVKKTGLVISGCTIADWSDGGNYTGDATMQ